MTSPGAGGEGVGVVGEDRPLSPDLLAVGALEAAAVQAVAALEVADAALLAGAVAREPPPGAAGAGLLAPSDEHPLGRQVPQRFGGRANLEAAVDGDLARGDPEPH